ncbi:MAG: hypothetical protein ACO2PO_07835 [Candidatus Calescibacterium sp.]
MPEEIKNKEEETEKVEKFAISSVSFLFFKSSNRILRQILLITSISLIPLSVSVKAEELKGYMYLYGEVGADYISDVDIPSLNKRGGNIAFSLGQFDILAKISYGKAEGLIEIPMISTVELPIWTNLWFERYYVGYNFHELFSLKIGGTYGAMGYLSRNWHRAFYLMPTIRRPIVTNSEDEGGILPLYATGIEANGEASIGEFRPGYIFQVINGNYHFGSDDLLDYDREKTFLGKIYIRRYLEEIGISLGYDPFRIPTEDGGSIYVQNFIAGLNLSYIKLDGLIGLAEGFIIGDRRSKTLGGGGFLILSYRILDIGDFDFRPFLQFGFMDWQDGNPFFEELNKGAEEVRKRYVNMGPGTVKHLEYAGGIRIGITPYFALKIGFNYYDIKNEKDLYYISVRAGWGIPVFER